MIRVLALVISAILAVEPMLWAAQGPGQVPDTGTSRSAGTGSDSGAEREARLLRLIETLKSLTDEDYEAALAQVPEKSRAPQFASRGTAMTSAYKTLAGLEYRKASQAAPEETAARYTQAYERVSAKAGGLEETGREVEVLKWLANAVLNYWIKGGETFVGRSTKAASEAEKTLAGIEVKLADTETDPGKKAELHYKRGALFERLSQAPTGPEAEAEKLALKTERLKKLADLLGSVSDEEYREALKSAPDAAKQPNLASRSKVLHSAYATLAALEYRQAAKEAPEESSKRYAAAYERVSKENAGALTVDPETLQETGWAGDLFKFMGNAALNYWLHGGEDYMARGWKGKGGSAAPNASQEEAAAAIGPGKEADRHFAQGSAYEKLSKEALQGGKDEDRAAVKTQRLKMLADLLESVSDEEYSEVVASLPSESAARSLPASRSKILKGAYTTLAALEYRAAADAAPKTAAAPYQADLERVSRAGAKDLAIDPSTLQETGWGAKLLGLLALGGIGYGVYELQRRDHGRGRGRKPSRPGPVPQTRVVVPYEGGELGCPQGTRREKDQCVGTIGAIDDEDKKDKKGDVADRCVKCPELACGCDCLGMPRVCGRPEKKLDSPEKIRFHAAAGGLEDKLSTAPAAEQASLHSQLGQVYERLAASAGTTVAEAPAADKTAAAPEAVKAPASPSTVKAPAGPAATDVLFLWDGTRIEGQVTAATPEKIVLKTDNSVTGIKQETIRALVMRGAEIDTDSEDIRSAASQGELPLILKSDGTTARGKLASASGQKLHFKVSAGVLSLSRDQIRAVVFPGSKKGR
ncbi:MAG: hypothetical protein HZB91_13480 [Elusimicrobia bacterium]|nr:hypothetical protein [Elusimicrobiota bacterium]